ncbi:hypothetical protein A9Q81_21645 [Gammaproteobacteria bacterium 42_54_T18]|nr:hypothetical protein A9Q81_21645 [Gammaproteobacteria bacterium 42_54_T18]
MGGALKTLKYTAGHLVFVYNADSGMLNLMKDIAHKLLSPATYPCSLCDLTYSAFGERRSWIRFRKALPVSQQYLHIDEFVSQYSGVTSAAQLDTIQYPVIFRLRDNVESEDNALELVATKQQIDACESQNALKSLVRSLLV